MTKVIGSVGFLVVCGVFVLGACASETDEDESVGASQAELKRCRKTCGPGTVLSLPSCTCVPVPPPPPTCQPPAPCPAGQAWNTTTCACEGGADCYGDICGAGQRCCTRCAMCWAGAVCPTICP